MTAAEFRKEYAELEARGNRAEAEAFFTGLLEEIENDRSFCSNCGLSTGTLEPEYVLTVLNTAAAFYHDLREFGPSVDLYQKLLVELALNGLENTPDAAAARISRAVAYAETGEPGMAKGDLIEAAKILSECRDEADLANASEPGAAAANSADASMLADLARSAASVYAQLASMAYRKKDFTASAEQFNSAAELLKEYAGEGNEYAICRKNAAMAQEAAK